MSLGREIQTDESTALDYNDISKLLSGRVSGMRMGFVDLENLHEYKLENFLPHHRNCCAILLTATFGNRIQRHWSCLIRNPKGLFFFESLGLGKTLLSRVLGNSKFVSFLESINAQVNTHKLQRNSAKIRTCGLHLCIRLAKRKLTNREYSHWLQTISLKPDETVALLSYLGHHT